MLLEDFTNLKILILSLMGYWIVLNVSKAETYGKLQYTLYWIQHSVTSIMGFHFINCNWLFKIKEKSCVHFIINRYKY